MTKEEKELLFRDICGRIPYGTKAKYDANGVSEDVVISLATVKILQAIPTDREFPITIKPYLHPMSSMTEKETKIHGDLICNCQNYEVVDWLNAHHFDYRGLIEKGLAIEAPEGMYKNE